MSPEDPIQRSSDLSPDDPELLEKLVDQFTDAMRQGVDVSIQSYQRAFPQYAYEIHELLTSVAMIEQLKSESDQASKSNRKLLDGVSNLKEIGSYRIIRETGRGGMGIVFEAVHDSLGRRVAIKVMPTPLVDAEKHIERFRREAQSAAKLHHTNIVSVFGVGEAEGCFYYVMDYVDGQSLNQTIAAMYGSTPANRATRIANTARDGDTPGGAAGEFELSSPAIQHASDPVPLTPGTREFYRWVGTLGANVADSLAYAHEMSILHRDIKPSNLMLDRAGVVWVTDFGLAKDSSQELNLTRTGDVIGTPQYLAPESLEGQYDQRSEVYCLGLTLYELATGNPAYPTASPAEMIRAIATRRPVEPRKLQSSLPRDLNTIINKCLQAAPNNRYATAQQLKNDLQAFADDQPIAARRAGTVETAIRWSRRNPLPATLAAISLLLLCLVAVVASIGYISTMYALDQEAEKSNRLATQQLATERARQQAEQNLAEMRLQFDRAEANVAMTLEAFDEMFKQLVGGPDATDSEIDVDGFRELAGIESGIRSEDVKRIESLLQYYEKFASLNDGNELLRNESAKAYRRVGNLHQLVGEMPTAIEAYQKSLQLYQPIWSESTDPKTALLEHSGLLNELSQAYRKHGKPAQAHAVNRDAIQLLKENELSRQDADVKLELARTLTATGLNLFRYLTLVDPQLPRPGKPERPEIRHSSLEALKSQFSKGPVWGERGRRGFLRNMQTWGELIQGGRGMAEQRNRQLMKEAIEIVDQLITEDPDHPEYRSVRGTCNCILAAAAMQFSTSSGQQFRQAAVDEFQQLVETDPSNAEHRYLLAMAGAIYAPPASEADRQLLSQSIGHAERLVDQFPGRGEYLQLVGSLNLKLATIELDQQRPELALPRLKSANDAIAVLFEEPDPGAVNRRLNNQLRASARRTEELLRRSDNQERRRQAQELMSSINQRTRRDR